MRAGRGCRVFQDQPIVLEMKDLQSEKATEAPDWNADVHNFV
jgi:hypothetical protein